MQSYGTYDINLKKKKTCTPKVGCWNACTVAVSSLHDAMFAHIISSCRWYKGNIKRHEAEEILLAKSPRGAFVHPDGAFLVRGCESQPGEFSLSVK